MTDLPPARAIRRAPLDRVPCVRVPLAHHERVLRRRRLATDGGEAFLVDLPRTASIAHGDAFELADGRLIEAVAAEEALLEIRGDLARLAWHVGNRHAPCEVGDGWLRVAADPVMARMLEGLGAEVRAIQAPFHPEGGAYGEGTPMGHSHGSHAHRPEESDDPLRLAGLAHDPR